MKTKKSSVRAQRKIGKRRPLSIAEFEAWAIKKDEFSRKISELIDEVRKYCDEESSLALLYDLAANSTQALNQMAEERQDLALKLGRKRIMWPISKEMGGSDIARIKSFFKAIDLGQDPDTVIDVPAFVTGRKTVPRKWAVDLSKAIHGEIRAIARFTCLGKVERSLFDTKAKQILEMLRRENPGFTPQRLEHLRLLLRECASLDVLNKTTYPKWRLAMRYQLHVTTNCRPEAITELKEIGAHHGSHAGAAEGSGTWIDNVRQRIAERIYEALKSLVKPASLP